VQQRDGKVQWVGSLCSTPLLPAITDSIGDYVSGKCPACPSCLTDNERMGNCGLIMMPNRQEISVVKLTVHIYVYLNIFNILQLIFSWSI
jgi:hypothetical protein